MGGLKSEIVGNKAFFSLSYSEDNRSLLVQPGQTEVSDSTTQGLQKAIWFKVCSPLTPGGAQRSSGPVVVQTFLCPALTTTWSRCGTREATRRLFSNSQATRTRFSAATGPAVRWSPAVVLTTI